MKIRIATRKSPLALWQANFIKDALLQLDDSLEISLVGLSTKGDREPSVALTKLGGKTVFVKELQHAVLNNAAEITVHSIKDMSVQDCPGLVLAAICERDDPRDAFVSNQYASIEQLPEAAIVGTSSPRRTALLKAKKANLQTKVLRGNVGTRVKKLDEQQYDAIILAVAGLKRLGLEDRITEYLDPSEFIPAIGQAAIGIECREKDAALQTLIKQLNHPETENCVIAERAVNKVLGGDCFTPLAAHAHLKGGELYLQAMVGSLDGRTIIESQISGQAEQASLLGKNLGNDLLAKGAAALLSEGGHHV